MYINSVEPEMNIEYVPLGAKCKVHYIAYNAETHEQVDSSLIKGDTDTKDAEGIPIEFTVGNNEVILGIDKAVRFMKKGQTAYVKIPWQMAYGEFGNGSNVPPKTDLLYEITVTGFQKNLGGKTSKEDRDHLIPSFITERENFEDNDTCDAKDSKERSVEDLLFKGKDGEVIDFEPFDPICDDDLEDRKKKYEKGDKFESLLDKYEGSGFIFK